MEKYPFAERVKDFYNMLTGRECQCELTSARIGVECEEIRFGTFPNRNWLNDFDQNRISVLASAASGCEDICCAPNWRRNRVGYTILAETVQRRPIIASSNTRKLNAFTKRDRDIWTGT